MSYNKCHTDIGYENEPSVETPLNETNLNYTDHCVDILDDRVVALDVAKLAVSEANSFITNITMNDATGIFTITKRDGTSYTIDTKLEKIAVNFRYDSATQKLIITLSDGTTQEVDLSSLITENEFTDSTTIAFTVVGHNVSATVKAGSITDSMLESGFLAAAQAAKSGAELAKSGADASALKAEGFAVGQQGGIDVPSTSPYHDNNAKFYAAQAETSAANAANSEDNASDYASAASTSATNASNSASAASTSAGNASTSATNAGNSADAAADSATEASEYAASASGSASTATSKASEAGGYATSANASRLESEGYAVGTQDGVEVPSTSPYYHNNAKYYSEQASGQYLSALNDVSISNPQSGESLVYDSTTQKWVNGEASIDVIDNLTSTSTTDALSANQGRVLDEKKADSGYTAMLPSEYQQVAYIESHGTEYIDTGVSVGENVSVEFIGSARGPGYTLFGAAKSTNPTTDAIYVNTNTDGQSVLFAWSTDKIETLSPIPTPVNDSVTWKLTQGKLYANNIVIGSLNAETWTGSILNIWLFSRNTNGSPANSGNTFCYGCKLWQNDTLIRNFIPCYRISDSVAGLYDTVNGVFYDNDGTGTFGVGADVVPKTLKEVDDAKVNISDIVNDLTHTDIDKPLAANQGKALDGKITDLKFLGWSVPKECPIQNTFDNEAFHQKVGRVNLGGLEWTYNAPYKIFYSKVGALQTNYNYKGYMFKYEYRDTSSNKSWNNSNFVGSHYNVFIHDETYSTVDDFKTAMQGVYLYYELETEILHYEGSEISESINDLKFLGWSVPGECPIRNYMDSNRVFHQKVGRIDLGNCNWDYLANRQLFYTLNSVPSYLNKTKGYCYKYPVTQTDMDHTQDKCITTFWRNFGSDPKVIIKDSSYTDATVLKAALQGVFLYFELETEILHYEGSEISESIKGLGNSIGMRGWNQLIYGDFGSDYTSYWKVYSGTGSVSNGVLNVSRAYGRNGVRLCDNALLPLINGHKYLFSCDYYTDVILQQYCVVSHYLSTLYNWTTYREILTFSGLENQKTMDTFPDTPGQVGNFKLRNIMCIDLTALFGAGNEPSTVEVFRAMFPAKYYPYCSGFGDLLWTNASPTSEFVQQDLAIDISKYNYLAIVYKRTTSNATVTMGFQRILHVAGTEHLESALVNSKIAQRDWLENSNYINMGGGWMYSSYGSYTADNSVMIPYQIYGIK